MFKDDLLKGKTILITGGGTGLGKSIAGKYLTLGTDLYIVGQRAGVLEECTKELMGEHGGSVVPIPCNIKDVQSIEGMMDDIWTVAPLAGLANNAAGNFSGLTAFGDEQWDAIRDTIKGTNEIDKAQRI